MWDIVSPHIFFLKLALDKIKLFLPHMLIRPDQLTYVFVKASVLLVEIFVFILGPYHLKVA